METRSQDEKKMHLAYSSLSHYVDIDGCKIRYLKAGAGSPLLLIHTLRTQLDYFKNIVPELAGSYQVYALDLPGNGLSGFPGKADYSEAFFRSFIQKFIDTLGLTHIIIVGESIGGTLALTVAATDEMKRIEKVFALNPYDYGQGGGIKRSSFLANIVFTTMKWPLVGRVVSHLENKWILRKILQGGLYNNNNLPDKLLNEFLASGRRKGYPKAFRSTVRNWRTWLKARGLYSKIQVPVTLIYGEEDWSRTEEKALNNKAIPQCTMHVLSNTSHFSCLDNPDQILRIIKQGN